MQAMLVHPDKNMGSPLASESFKKLQCAYEVSILLCPLSLSRKLGEMKHNKFKNVLICVLLTDHNDTMSRFCLIL